MICSTIQSIDKALVARRFAHARNTYGREALVQQQTGVAPGSPSELYDMAEGRGVA